jgi:hypothetical protein
VDAIEAKSPRGGLTINDVAVCEPSDVSLESSADRANTAPIEISLEGTPARPLPPWARWLIDLGQSWGAGEQRRVALVSMPCDSPGAGLVAVGALIGDLTRPRATDVDGHFDSLIRYAQQYVSACRDCDRRCKPKERRCGYLEESTGKLRHVRGGLLGPVTGTTSHPTATIQLKKGTGTVSLHAKAASSYYVHHAPPIVTPPESALASTFYRALAGSADFVASNLCQTYSGLCFAGRVLGAEATRSFYEDFQFRTDSGQQSLASLLTISGWGSTGVSRVKLFNTRTQQFDRASSYTKLVVADGEGAFERVLGSNEFASSDVIGVLHRTVADDSSRALAERLAGMRQWYAPEAADFVSAAPRGIALSLLRRRS